MDGSCVRLRLEYRNHVRSYDFVEDRTHGGRKYRMLNVVDVLIARGDRIRVSKETQFDGCHRRAISFFSHAAFQVIFVPIIAQNSSRRR